MNGAHDLGGQHGLGPIAPEPESAEPVFHHDWERRVFALTLACGMLGKWNIDESRFARERQHPLDYLHHSYYENWLAGLETLLEEKHLLAAASELGLHIPTPVDAEKLLAAGTSAKAPLQRAPTFQPGESVRVRRMHTRGHTRAPAYVQGAVGSIELCHGNFVFPDQHALAREGAELLYSVRFSGLTLWGEPVAADVLVDLWEPYLELVQSHD